MKPSTAEDDYFGFVLVQIVVGGGKVGVRMMLGRELKMIPVNIKRSRPPPPTPSSVIVAF
jgi:hypothetical protein